MLKRVGPGNVTQKRRRVNEVNFEREKDNQLEMSHIVHSSITF